MKLPSIWLLILALVCRVVLGERIAVFLFCRAPRRDKGEITLDEFFEDLGRAGAQAARF